MSSPNILGQALLRPKSVAIIGASDDPTKPTARPLQHLRRTGFAGAIYPINPKRDSVLGERAWPSIAALPETPDQVFVLASTAGVPEAVRDCVARGVPLVSVLAGGFGEEGEVGRAREAELKAILAGGKTRLIGPNSIGVVNITNGLMLTANAAFAEPKMTPGGLFVASHSGSMIGAILSRGVSRGIGFAGFVSTGAELDLNLGELCEATLDDPAIDAYGLFLETIHHGEAMRRFALAAAERGKPVIAYKLGRSAQAAELSQSHTGAIAGEDAIAEAFFRDCGIVRIDTLEALIEAPALVRRIAAKPARAPQVAVVSTTGGGAAMVVDQLGVRGVEVAPPTAQTLAKLAERGVSANPGRIVDLTMAGTRAPVMKAALQTLLEAPEFDLVVAVAGSSARFQPQILVPAMVEAAASSPKPLAAFMAPDAPEALAMLTQAAVPCFRTPESCGDAIAAAFARRPPKPMTPERPGGAQRQIDEAEGYAELAKLGVPVAPHAVVGVDAQASPLAYPVAVKLLDAEVLHKTELGGVALGIKDDAAFRDAAAKIKASVEQAQPGLKAERLLVQAMTQSLGEVLLSFTRDPDAGPLVMLAAGGILAEIHKDRSLRLAPVDHDEAWAMIGEVKALKALAGFRGRAKGDLEALAQAIVAISRAGAHIVEAEINPLMVKAEGAGVAAVDAVVRVREVQG